MATHGFASEVERAALGDFRTWLINARRDFAVSAVNEISSFSGGDDAAFALERLKPALEVESALRLLQEYEEQLPF